MSAPKFQVGDRVDHVRSKKLKGGRVRIVTRDHPHNHPRKGWWYVVTWDYRPPLWAPGFWDDCYWAECVLKEG